jgi:dolichol-phosphate mannosyltransferase
LTLRFGEVYLRFVGFALVGMSGILVNSMFLFLATEQLRIYYLLSVVIATIASTLWNFSLTEGWVYRSEYPAQGRGVRLGLFFVMNTLALILRTPMIYILTSLLGLHYLVSNLISLVLLTISRFVLADNIIWGKTPSTSRMKSLVPR